MADQNRIVHLVDDDEAITRSASFMLRSLRYVVKTYASGRELLDALPEATPGCILLDVRMPGMDGLEVQAMLKARHVTWPIIIMTGHGDIALAVQAMKAGALDFLEKPFHRTLLVAALDEGFLQIEQAGHKGVRGEEALARLETLTGRERDVLEGLVQGHPNKRIAQLHNISPRTVEIHRANLMEKLGIASLSQALRLAFNAGLGDGEALPRA